MKLKKESWKILLTIVYSVLKSQVGLVADGSIDPAKMG